MNTLAKVGDAWHIHVAWHITCAKRHDEATMKSFETNVMSRCVTISFDVHHMIAIVVFGGLLDFLQRRVLSTLRIG
ncbi:hypothetical protein [Lysobacter antibioticus]|uniref:hypothetical protein n=1 Tax=Lysobacter antibioticus TaxID=84531 RepID=UPI0011DFD1A7|nr:hypothetical protein [Lysobacter antibioticus]